MHQVFSIVITARLEPSGYHFLYDKQANSLPGWARLFSTLDIGHRSRENWRSMNVLHMVVTTLDGGERRQPRATNAKHYWDWESAWIGHVDIALAPSFRGHFCACLLRLEKGV